MGVAGDLFMKGFKTVERKLTANGPVKSLRDVVYHKELKEHINSAVRSDLQASQNAALGYMQGDYGLLAAGGDRGRRGLEGMAGAWKRFRGQGDALEEGLTQGRQQISDLVSKGARDPGSPLHGEYLQATKAMNDMRQGFGGVGRYTSAAWQAAGGALKYMNSGSLGQRAAKFGAAGAAWVGVSGAARGVASGGSAFYNGDGQRDIAGIPFI